MALVMASVAACTSAAGSHAAGGVRPPTLDHVWPPRDSNGAGPEYFEWTPVAGADHYAIVVSDEIDRLIWRHDRVQEASVDLPAGVRLEPGTYFWTVLALDADNRPLVNSGRSAFVVSR